ncbi:MAG TPA: substrate-binding domain-containing protein [Prosthecobacter sp.]|nr:substrate-binding domain-containing protein [Prosthecobacter sp.]
MRLRPFIASLPLLLCGLSLLPGCKPAPETAGEETAAPKTVILLTAHADLPFEAAQRQYLMQLLAKQTRAVLQTHDAGGNAEAQASQLAQATAAKPFAIIVDPVDAKALAARVKEAADAGVLVVGLGQTATAARFTTALYSDQFEIGRLAGEIAVRALTMKAQEENRPEITGRVVEIRGSDEAPQCAQRHEGFLEALKAIPGAVLVHDAPGGWTKTGGKERLQEALRVQKTFDVVYAHNDAMALGAAEAAGDQRESLLIIGTDGFRAPEGGFTLVNNGDIDASVYQPLLVDFAWTIIRKKMDDPNLVLKPSYRLTPQAITPKEIEKLRREGMPPFPAL